MRAIRLTFFLLLLVLNAAAQQNYDVSLISKELLPHASAVVRDKEETVVVEGMDNTIYHIKQVITILNKNGDHMANLNIGHDKSTIIKYVKGTIYNEFGKQIGKFTEGNFEDFAGWDGFSLFLDARVKHYTPAVTTYPYTIAYDYELRLKQTLDFPEWEPMPNHGVSVEKSSFS